MSAFLDILEDELGALVDTILERTHDDDTTPPAADASCRSRRMGKAVLWRVRDPHNRYTLYGLYEALPAKGRVPAQIHLERVRMIMTGKFSASYHFDSWRLGTYGSLKVHGFYPQLELASFLYMLNGFAPAFRNRIDAALIQDQNPDRTLIMAGL